SGALGPGARPRRGGPGGPPRGDLPDPGRRRSTGPNSVTVEAPRDVRFLAATVLVAVALAWAFFARAALPTRVEGLRLMVASVLAALAFTPVGPRRRQGLLLGLLSAWLLLNLWDARWLSILTTNFTTPGRWASAHRSEERRVGKEGGPRWWRSSCRSKASGGWYVR